MYKIEYILQVKHIFRYYNDALKGFGVVLGPDLAFTVRVNLRVF